MNKLLPIITSAVLLSGIASATPFSYFTSFSGSESPGFSDGALDTQNTWVAHPSFSVSDVTGMSLLNHVNADGPVHLGTSEDLTSELAAGETITLTLAFSFVGELENQNDGAWLLGLTDNANGVTQLASNTIGSAAFQDITNSNFWLSPIEFPLDGSKFDTGLPSDDGFHMLTTTITRSAIMNEFEITTDLDGQSTSYLMTHEGLWTGADTAYAGFRFRGQMAGNIDSFSVSSTGVADGGGGGGGNNDAITINDSSYETGTGLTINYTSSIGPVDVYRNATGDLSSANFSLIATGETGGSYTDSTVDPAADPKAFYLLVSEGDLPFEP